MTVKDKDLGPTWAWLAGILLMLLISIGSWNLNTAFAQIEDLRAKQSVAEIAGINLRNDIERVREAQEREHKLLVQIAEKMGIEVAR